jgi:hypothetical protein
MMGTNKLRAIPADNVGYKRRRALTDKYPADLTQCNADRQGMRQVLWMRKEHLPTCISRYIAVLHSLPVNRDYR